MDTEVKIDLLEKAQIPRAAKILTQAFNMKAGKAKKDLAYALPNDGNTPVTFTAAINDNVVGVIRLLEYPHKEEAINGACLFSLAVDKAFRGYGIGHKLVGHAEDYIAKEIMQGQKGFVSLADHTKKTDPDSGFYESMDYLFYKTEEGATMLDEEGMPLMYKYVNAKKTARKKKTAGLSA